MIQSFRCRHTQALFAGRNPRPFRSIHEAAERKLQLLDAAQTLDFLRSPRATAWKPSKATDADSTASASTISGACALSGRKPVPLMSRSLITTEVPS